jgi:hypothetical protein
MILETGDDLAILGYAGLGSTALGNEPADWMSAVLRGRNMPLEPSLQVLAKVLREQFPRHLNHLPPELRSHIVTIPAFVENQPRLYGIKFAFDRQSNDYSLLLERQTGRVGSIEKTPRFGLTGTGAACLLKKQKEWVRPLLHLVKAYDRGRISAYAVADYLAKLNHEAHLGTPDQSVGDRCIVAWRHKPRGTTQNGGGGSMCYTGTTREAGGASIPLVSNGSDLRAILDVLARDAAARLRPGVYPVISAGEELSRIPRTPDDRLR